MTAMDVQKHLKTLASPERAVASQRFFKTGPGEYGEGDSFVGIQVPVLRKLARQYRDLPLHEVGVLLASPIHEARHLALMILVLQVSKCDDERKREVFDFYLENKHSVNNWDLVDCSAPYIVGGYLLDQPRRPLYPLAKSTSLWDRRISIVATQHFIRHGDFGDTLAISKQLMDDKEDLIHKATGWMLREVGKKDETILHRFLQEHAGAMPRTMLRYAIEKFPPAVRRRYLDR